VRERGGRERERERVREWEREWERERERERERRERREERVVEAVIGWYLEIERRECRCDTMWCTECVLSKDNESLVSSRLFYRDSAVDVIRQWVYLYQYVLCTYPVWGILFLRVQGWGARSWDQPPLLRDEKRGRGEGREGGREGGMEEKRGREGWRMEKREMDEGRKEGREESDGGWIRSGVTEIKVKKRKNTGSKKVIGCKEKQKDSKATHNRRIRMLSETEIGSIKEKEKEKNRETS
jgi:hypothetical protein